MRHDLVRFTVVLGLTLALLAAVGAPARAETLQAPVGGKAIPLGERVVACGPASGGWSVEPDGRAVHPPVADAAVGQSVELEVAPDPGACAASRSTVTLTATGAWPTIDPAATLLAVDEARLEIHGRRLRGVRVTVRSAVRTAEDVCLDATPDGGAERCTLAVGRDLPADPFALALSWSPPGGHSGADVITFDAQGRRAAAADLALPVAKITVNTVVPGGASVDFSAGTRRVALIHPEAVASASCSPAECSLEGGGVVVRAGGGALTSLALELKLLPRVFLVRGDNQDPAPSWSVPVLECPLSVPSGPPLRGVDDARLVARLGGACARDAGKLRFRVRGSPAEVLHVANGGDAAYAVLRAGRIEGSEVTVEALRPEPDAAVVGATRLATRPAPAPHTTLEIEGHGAIDFIPTNRDAVLHLAGAEGGLTLVPLPVDGVYTVDATAGGLTRVRALPSAAGFVALRFAYRVDGLPATLGPTDLGFAVEPVERAIHAVNLKAPLELPSDPQAKPLVEMLCDTAPGHVVVVRSGVPAHVPFTARDGCRIVFHRDRLAPEYGAQRITLDVDVTRVDGSSRPEGRVTQPIVLRHGAEDRVAWIKGVGAPFDRVSVRLGHAADESHYADADESLAEPAEQWSVIMGASRARLYATTAIPTGMYRVSDRDHSGILTLNFGVLGRLTWLDGEGQTGLLGLEAGVMGVGLANDTSASGKSLTQVAAVLGVGLGVPIANRAAATETSINLHAWLELEPGRFFGSGSGSPVGFVFGPSITIGNVGTNL